MINPLLRPQENQLQGDALVEQIQMRMQQRDVKTPAFMKYAGDVFETQGYPTKTMQEYENLFPSTNQRQPVSLLEAGSNANFNVSPSGMLNVTPLPDIPKNIASPGLPSLNLDPEGLQEAIRTVDPIVSGDNSIASTQQVPFDRIGQQIINFEDMFGPLNTRLNKIEEGIASLLDNRGQGLNMNTMPTRNLNNFFQEPMGTFPFRSFYG